MDHTQACLDAFARHADTTLAFRTRYPHACTLCRGWGYTSYSYDPSPSGVSLSSGSVTMTEPCPACEGHDDAPTCALCGQLLADDARLCTCPPDGGLPEGPECCCWYEAEQQALAELERL